MRRIDADTLLQDINKTISGSGCVNHEKEIIECIESAPTIEEKTVVEYCPNCETEIEMRWDIESMGYKAFCPVCGNRLMLCDECQHRTGGACTEDCDYDTRTDTCRFNPGKEAGEAEA